MSPEEVRGLLRRAERSLRSARNLLEDGDNDFAVSRAYYTMFYAAKALLLAQEIRRSKHSGVIAAFGEHFVKSGRLAREYLSMLQTAFRQRGEGDYGDVFPSREQVEARLADAQRFLAATCEILRAEGLVNADGDA